MNQSTINAESAVSIFSEFLRESFADRYAILENSFEKLTNLYFEVNSIINISALRTLQDVYIKHYLDSIHPYKLFSGSCCDVGCGGGFPCLPLALVTNLDFVALESVGKKLTLVERARSKIGINNITPVKKRAEDYSKEKIGFDTVCARAVSDINTSLSYCAPLAKKDGNIILYKTKNDTAADKKITDKLGVKLVDTIDYTLYKTDINRRIFVYKKMCGSVE